MTNQQAVREFSIERYRSMISDGLGLSTEGVQDIINHYESLQKENARLVAELESVCRERETLKNEIYVRDLDAQRDGQRRVQYWREVDGERAQLIKERDTLLEELKRYQISSWDQLNNENEQLKTKLAMAIEALEKHAEYGAPLWAEDALKKIKKGNGT